MPATKLIRIIFAGTPHFAVPFLTDIIKDTDFHVVGVLTQPDRPAGRKQILTPSPIKQVARKHEITVLQPESLKDNNKILMDLMDLAPDLMVVVAYGQIIPPELLSVAKFGNINLHFSLLPKWRGASPVQASILNGDTQTGVTITLMDEMLDHGPILRQEEWPLTGQETNDSLHEDLAPIGVRLLSDTIKKLVAGEINFIKQNHDEATFCKTITKNQAKIDWTKPASQIDREIRAYYSWPISWTTYQGKRIKIFPPIVVELDPPLTLNPGQIKIRDDKMIVGCGSGNLIISKLQMEGKEVVAVTEFLKGYKDMNGKYFK